MSQFEGIGNPYGQESTPRKTSGLAITALVCSLIFCCPITTVIGVLLGAIAYFSIGSNPARRGKGIAMAAIIIGLIASGLQLFAYPKVVQFFYTFYEAVEEGPREALAKGFAGDTAGFKAEFYGAGATTTDAEVQAFIDELRSRYGAFVNSTIDESQPNAPRPQPGQPQITMPYVLEFANETTSANAEIIFADQSTGDMPRKLGYLVVRDAVRGDLRYPATTPPPVGPTADPPMDMESPADGDNSPEQGGAEPPGS